MILPNFRRRKGKNKRRFNREGVQTAFVVIVLSNLAKVKRKKESRGNYNENAFKRRAPLPKPGNQDERRKKTAESNAENGKRKTEGGKGKTRAERRRRRLSRVLKIVAIKEKSGRRKRNCDDRFFSTAKQRRVDRRRRRKLTRSNRRNAEEFDFRRKEPGFRFLDLRVIGREVFFVVVCEYCNNRRFLRLFFGHFVEDFERA